MGAFKLIKVKEEKKSEGPEREFKIIHLGNGDIYHGEVLNGLPDGRGNFLKANGSRYEGEWSKGKKDGYGISTLSNGNKYEGGYKSNRKHGKGEFESPSIGITYVGVWRNGKLHGKAK